jgi:hypothetical protein
LDEANPECIIERDEFKGDHRNCDLVGRCRAEAQHITISKLTRRLMSLSEIPRSERITIRR